MLISGSTYERAGWDELLDDAYRYSLGLRKLGVGPDEHVCVLGPTSRGIVTAIQALLLLGASFTVLPTATRTMDESSYASHLSERIRTLKSSLLLYDRSVTLAPKLEVPTVRLELSRVPFAVYGGCEFANDSRPAFIQFTSGSTEAAKGIAITRAQLVSHVDAIAQAAEFGPDEVHVSWLPLFHDMGLVGFLLTPMLLGHELILMDPQEFIQNPGTWMTVVDDFDGTITGAPNFAYAMAARSNERLRKSALRSLRLAFNGSEPVDKAVVDRFGASADHTQYKLESMFPVYGMAEATLAIAFPTPGDLPEFDVVDVRSLRLGAPVEFSNDEHSRPIAVVGSPLPGVEVRISSPTGEDEAPQGRVGEIQIRGSSVVDRYMAATFSAIDRSSGWFPTGDLGYAGPTGLRVCGRIKDMIIVAGRNVDPWDIESAASHVDGVQSGAIVAFGVANRGTEGVVVIAERHRSHAPVSDGYLRRAVRSAVSAACGITPVEVVVVDRGTLPKTTSGKLQRAKARLNYLSGTIREP